MLFPASTGLGVAVLVTARSACVAFATRTLAVALAAAGFGSGVPELPVAVLEIVEPRGAVASTVTTSVKVADPPFANGVASVHEIFPVIPTPGVVQFQAPGAVKERNVVFVGTVSTRLVATAAAGPMFCRTSLYVIVPPGGTEVADAVFVSVRNAEVAEPTTLMAVAVLFARLGSFVPEVIAATSTICVPKTVPALTCATTVNVPVPPAPLGKFGFVHVIFPVARMDAFELQVQPAGAVMD